MVTFFPGRVVRIGDRWQGKLQAGFGLFGGGTVEMLKTYCYEGKEPLEGRSLEKISFTGEATVSLMKKEEAPRIKITKVDLKCSALKGVILFDETASRPVRSEMSFRLSGPVTFDIAGKPFVVEIDADYHSEVRRLDKAPLEEP
jgi:hypothetical protein